MADRANTAAEFAALIRGQRLALRLTQIEAARRAGVSLATWQSLERSSPTARFAELTLSRAAEALRLPVAEVFAAAGKSWDASELSVDAVAEGDAVAAACRELTALAAVSAEDAQFVAALTRGLCQRLRGDVEQG